MMRLPWIALFVVCIALLRMGFAQEVMPAPTITRASVDSSGIDLYFSESMLAWNGDGHFTAATIHPSLHCRWYWSSDTELRCNVDGDKLPPASRYRISIQGGLWSQQGFELKAQELWVETPRPEIDYEYVDEWNDGVPVIDLHTNFPVNATTLHEALHLTLDDQVIGFDLQATGQSTPTEGDRTDRDWRIRFSPADGLPHELALSVRPGLRAAQGELTGTQDEVLLRARVNEPFRLRRTGCAVGHEAYGAPVTDAPTPVRLSCPAGQMLILEFSRDLSAGSLTWLREHLPPGLRFEREDAHSYFRFRAEDGDVSRRPGSFIRLTSDLANRLLELKLPDSLTSDTGKPIVRDVLVEFATTDFLPDLSIEPGYMVVPLDSETPRIISMVNQRRPAVSQAELADANLKRTKSHLRNGRKNTQVWRTPPDPRRELRKRGGLIQGAVTPLNQAWSSYVIAFAAFNVTVSRSGDHFLVWATDWKNAEPVRGATVELLTQTATDTVSVLASAITGEDGVALIDTTAVAGELERNTPIIRVQHEDLLTVMPLVQQLANGGRYEYRDVAAEEGQAVAWGVTERSLYHPGETVQYRLWLRKRQQNHLRPIADTGKLKLRLVSQWTRKQMLEVNAELDRFGSMSGEFRLPKRMPDENYCITADAVDSYLVQGACFRVSGYHVNNLWVELHVDRDLVRAGESIELVTRAGYFSGGAAAGAKSQINNLLLPLRIEDAYPEFSEFTFIDPYEQTAGSGGEMFELDQGKPVFTDTQGQARRRITLEDESGNAEPRPDGPQPIPFGQLDFSVAVSTSPSNWVTAPASLRFSRHARFVGLKVSPWFLDGSADPEAQAVLISDQGKQIDDVAIEVRILKLAADESEQDKEVASCQLRSGLPGHCRFRPQHSGRYRFVATAENAAPASLERYAWLEGDRQLAEKDAAANLSTENTEPAAGSVVEVLLHQPFKDAMVLFSVEHGGVLKHWIERIKTPTEHIRVPVERDWAPGFTLHAVVLDSSSDPFAAGQGTSNRAQTASLDFHVTGETGTLPLELTLDKSQIKPGGKLAITLRNPRSNEVQVTLAVVDDAARALVPEITAAASPNSEGWLGLLNSWSVPDWFALGNWPRQPEEHAGELPYIFGFTSASATANESSGDSGSERLDTIVVTGSNIRAVDLFQPGQAMDHSLAYKVRGQMSQGALRNRFVDAALWKTDLVLAAGAKRTVELTLPDNLTRWRALAWAADANDGFTLSEATVEATLPLEVRTEVPTRLFPGDHSRISASVRAQGEGTLVKASLQAEGAGVTRSTSWQGAIAENAQQSVSLLASPTQVGEIVVNTRANSKRGADGVAASVEIAPTLMHQRIPVAGWLTPAGVDLRIPELPSGAVHPTLSVEASRGLTAIASPWIDGLREYPHRCWEQTLSRAIGAAASVRLGLADANWPDVPQAIDEALRAAGQFQDREGFFHFFADVDGLEVSPRSLMLTAYSVQGLEYLKSLGYQVQASRIDRARQALLKEFNGELEWLEAANTPYRNQELVAAATVIGANSAIPESALGALWKERGKLSWQGLANLALALAQRKGWEANVESLLESLRNAGEPRGAARVIQGRPGDFWPFQSNALDHCGVLRALGELDHASDAGNRRLALMRGLADLYAGGTQALDTQSSAQCLMTVLGLPEASGLQAPLGIALGAGDAAAKLELGHGQNMARWSREFSSFPDKLEMRADLADDALVSFVANVEYDIDGRKAQPLAVGFSLEREYSVIRDKQWVTADTSQMREGDWVRVRLRIHSSRMRYFVAISDSVPGGLRPMDLELAGVTELDLERIASQGSPWFPVRQVDDRHARFYAEQLPPGTHDVYYYARAVFAGKFLSLPAIAELMYGQASVSRTGSATVDIDPALRSRE